MFPRLVAIAGICALSVLAPRPVGAQGAAGYALRFFGSNIDDVDKVFIRVDGPAVPADVGATDFTLEFWMKATPGDNTNTGVVAGQNFSWINGNIVFDRDINGGADFGDFGISLNGCAVAFGIQTSEAPRTVIGSRNVCDGAWHHVAVQRRRVDGRLGLFVDGVHEVDSEGPGGDASYNDNRGGAPNDPFLVIGGEKHGFDDLQFRGWIDEVRISRTLRYSSSFSRPVAPFVADGSTAALYHFNEGSGTEVGDSSGAAGGPSPGSLRVGGSPAGPAWVISDAPLTGSTAPQAPTNLRIVR